MSKNCSYVQALLRAGLLSSLTLGAFQFSRAATVTLSPGANIQEAVASHPEGTTFILTTGIYRGQVVNPKDNDSFIGQGGTVYLLGSVPLDFAPDPQGTGLFVATAPSVINKPYGKCNPAAPLCGYPQDLYIHAVPQVPATSATNLQPGSWYFDREAKKVYLPSDPAGVAELGVNPYAFSSMATHVTISNIVVEKYANFAQFGAIGSQNTGAGWIVSNVASRYNHGVGIRLGTEGQILNSTIAKNGELGVSVTGLNSKVIGNVIASNNYAGYLLDWEGGGCKFSNTTNVLFSKNNVYDNIGPGLWGDSDNFGTVIDGNKVWNNQNAGIQFEISYSAVIKNNVAYGNGTLGGPSWLWSGQIQVQNSANVEVYDNIVEVSTPSGNGISIINQNRHPGALGPHIAENNYVHNNTITYDLTTGKSGMVNDTGVLNVDNNHFYDNKYILMTGDATNQHWAWFHYYDWKDLHSFAGQESGGTLVLP